MTSGLSNPELDDRIAIARDNIRQLTEQATGSLGAEDEERAPIASRNKTRCCKS